MAVPYHTHTFEIPQATKDDVLAGVSTDKAVVPAALGTAATKNIEDFATAAQGEAADNAIQPGDLATVATSGSYSDLTDRPTLGTAAAENVTAFATALQGAKADTAVQAPGGTAGQVLTKQSSTEGDVAWQDVAAATAVSYGPQSLTLAQQGQARANIGADLLSGIRNYIINGDFEISARGATFNTAGYTIDRWKIAYSGGTGRVGTINQYIDEAIAATIGSTAPQHLNWTETTSGTGYTSKTIQQPIENVRTLAGRLVTLTFWCVMPVGGPYTMTITLRQIFGSSGSPSASVDTSTTVSVPGDNTWRKFSITLLLPSIAGKTLTPGNSLTLILNMPTNVPFTFGVKRVSLVEGDATAEDDPFSPRQVQQELALCQRYYERSLITAYQTTPTTTVRYGVQFKVEKRSVPTVQLLAPTPDPITPSSLTVATIATDGFRASTPTGTADSGVYFGWAADAEL
ncbi:hypothetical protein [Brucella anthropi]|uniref:hypothetical protein n=1 Tax=Brucella anthropi TaxID=529 RepID=UPI00320A90CC